MKKNDIIRFLQNLSPRCICCLDIVFHKMTTDGSFYYRYQFSVSPTFPSSSTPLAKVLLTLWSLRRNVRAIHLVYLDSLNQQQQVEYIVRDFVPCDRLSDFINSKKIKYGKIY